MNHKDHSIDQAPGSPAQPLAGNPADVHRLAENPNPRANENLADKQDDRKEPASDVGSEITDGEDA